MAGDNRWIGAEMSKYFLVRKDKKFWLKDAVAVEDFEARGFQIAPARRVGDASLFINGDLIAHLFTSKKAAAKFLFAA